MILAIDTSGNRLGLALCSAGDLKASSLTETGLRHGEILQRAIGELLAAGAAGFENVTGISIVLGPGSFTGLRIGLAAGKAYAYKLNIPMTGISTLLAGAYRFKNVVDEIMVITDARRKEFYYAGFDCRGDEPVRLTRDLVGSMADLKKSMKDNTILFGPYHLQEQIVAEIGQCDYYIGDRFNLAEPAAIRGERNILSGDILDIASAVPVYLRYPAYIVILLATSLLGVSANKFIYFHF